MDIWAIWIICALLLVIVEFLTPGFAVACVAIGAVAGGVSAALGCNVTWQFVFFAIVTLISFIFIRPFVLKLFFKTKGEEVKTNVDALVGRVAFVSVRIDNSVGGGRVAIDGDDWKAIAEHDEIIEKGARVTIVKQESVVLTVKSLNE